MDIKYLKSLVKLLDESNLSELEIEEEGGRIYLSKSGSGEVVSHQPIVMPQAAPQAVAAQVPTPSAPAASEAPAPAASSNFHEVTSPIVGTFYKSPSPDSPAFVSVGDKVQAGQTLCIIEAMKVMNEIESDISGTIESIVLSDASPVEYGEVLFHIKPD